MVTVLSKYADQQGELTALFCAGLSGDNAAYANALQKISILLRRTVNKKIPASDCEDVVQEILISVHKARHTYDKARPLLPWLYAIAQFRVNDQLRKLYEKGMQETDIDNFLEILSNPVTEGDSSLEDIEGLLKNVPERERKILTMMHVEGFTAKETGDRMDMKESAVKVAAHRAMNKIRKKFGV